MILGIGDQKPPLSAPAIFFKPNMPFELKLLQGGTANLSAPIHVRQSAGLFEFLQPGHIRDGTIRQSGGRGLEVLETSAVNKKGDPSGC